ncbi:hypothetical protein GCM10027217_40270 [Pseudomaricurvus hydrocarbonicus]
MRGDLIKKYSFNAQFENDFSIHQCFWQSGDALSSPTRTNESDDTANGDKNEETKNYLSNAARVFNHAINHGASIPTTGLTCQGAR